jgi:hypothetical protein
VDKLPQAITPEFGERLVRWLQSAETPAPPPELVSKVNVGPSPFDTAKDYLSNGITSEQALNAKAKIVQRGKDGVFTEEQVTELLELANKKAGT